MVASGGLQVEEIIALALELSKALEPFKPLFKVVSDLLGLFVLGMSIIIVRRVKAQNEELKQNISTISEQSAALNGTLEGLSKGQKEVSTTVVHMTQQTAASSKSIVGATTELGNATAALTLASDNSTASLRNTVTYLSTKVTDLLAEVKEVRDSLKDDEEEVAPGSWERVRDTWADTRDDVRLVVETIFENENDGRKLKPLHNLDYRNYSVVAEKLYKGGWINANGKTAIQDMDATFNRLKSVPDNAADDDADNMDRMNKQFKKATSNWVDY
jgi:chromosome segregation ATPase